MTLFNNFRIKHKMQATGVLYLILISLMIYFFMNADTLIKRVSSQQQSLNSLSGQVRDAEMAVANYVSNRSSVEDLNQTLKRLDERMKEKDLAKYLKSIQDQLERFSQLRSKNLTIEKEITALTEASLTASNDVIKKISDRLMGADTRADVSNMERAVIVGANTNTNANFRIRLLFGKLKEDIGFKDELVKFLDTLVENVTKDIEHLKGTENEAAARKARENNLAVKQLVLEYIGNVETLKGVEKEIFDSLEAIHQGIGKLVVTSSEGLFETVKGYFTTMIGAILFVSVIGILLNFIIANSISGSLGQLTHLVKDLAEGEGDLTKRLPVRSEDETGQLAGWINLFVEKLQAILREITGNADSLNTASSELAAISQQMTEGARQASDRSNSLSSAAKEMSGNMNSVAAASEQAATNVTMVAGASEEMASTVKEIAKNSEHARAITNDAVNKAAGATSNINRLGEAADQISKVTEVITEISEQTNLLALNATIEAARAGEAGKGFAVVANEIKELARQTAQATQEIKDRIDGIQNSSSQTVDEIKVVSEVINQVDEIVCSIASAVEEQSVSTQEIAGNVAQASQGIQEVNDNVSQSSTVSAQISREIDDVNQAAGMLTDSSAQVNMSADALSGLAGQLHRMVGRFKL